MDKKLKGKKPLISVVMPVFNAEREVKRAIDSVLAQTVLSIELVVVNDGSTDGSARVVEQFSDPRVVFVEQSNAGVAAARNRGIMEASSDLIAFLDADDEWHLDYVESILNLTAQYPECSVFGTSYLIRDGNDTALPSIVFNSEAGIISDYFSLACRGSPPLWTGSVSVKKSALLAIGLFTPGIKAGEDLLCWARLAQQYDIAFLNQPKATYHFPVNLGADREIRMPDTPDRVYQGLVALHQAEPAGLRKKKINRYIGHWCKMRLHVYTYKGLRENAIAEYRRLLIHDPLNMKALALLLLAVSPSFMRYAIFKRAKRGMS